MAENPTLGALRPVNRALLLPVGARAEAVAERALALGRDWLEIEPPMRLLSLSFNCPDNGLVGQSAGLPQAGGLRYIQDLAQACDELSGAVLASELRQAGWTFAHPDEIQAWLLLDVAETSAVSEQTQTSDPADLLAALAVSVWRRLRVHVLPHVLLLAEPADTQSDGTSHTAVAAWASRLASAGVEGLYVAGPVDCHHLRWSEPDWEERAAVGLAGLVCSDAGRGMGSALPITADWDSIRAASGTDLTGPGGGSAAASPEAWAVGAAAWPSPARRLKRWLAVHLAQSAIRRLLAPERPVVGNPPAEREKAPQGLREVAESDLPPWEVPGLLIAPERHHLALEASVPPAPAGETWGRRHLGFSLVRGMGRSLADLPREIRTSVERRAAQAQTGQYEPRGQWIAEHVADWEAGLAALHDERLHSQGGWPQMGRYRLELQALRSQLQAALVTIEDRLEDAGKQHEAAEATVRQAEATLADLCSLFPELTVRTAVALLIRPWRWPGLLWTYLISLPQAGQKLLNALAQKGQTRRREANVHALRQAYLAMAQTVEAEKHTLETINAALSTAETEIGGMAADLGDLPAPWKPECMERLLAHAEENLAPGFEPLGDWVGEREGPAKASTPERTAISVAEGPAKGGEMSEITGQVLAWAEEALSELDGWSAADWLAEALSDAEMERWLADFAQQAAPLWPGATAGSQVETWLAMPARKLSLSSSSDTVAEERLQAGMEAWAGARRSGPARVTVHRGTAQADVVLVVQRMLVELEIGS